MSFQSCPTYEQPIVKSGNTSSVWYRFFQGLYNGIAPGAESTVTAGGSPFTFTAPSRGFVILSGGSVSAVQFTRAMTTLTGQTAGQFALSNGDQLTVTYAGMPPTMVFVPQ